MACEMRVYTLGKIVFDVAVDVTANNRDWAMLVANGTN
jgi:hypothetical protein